MSRAFIDSHCHLQFDRFDDDRSAVIARAADAGFSTIVNVSTDLESAIVACEIARDHSPICRATIGLHPTSTDVSRDEFDRQIAGFRELRDQNPEVVVAYGEIGLDHYWETPRDKQRFAFDAQLDLAAELDLPIIIHCRDAWPETIGLIAPRAADLPLGVFHCFGGTAAEVDQVVEFGWYVSFAGNVTYKTAEPLREAARVCPQERLLLETDAPFLAPQTHRGERNEPLFALDTLTGLSTTRDESVDALGQATTENARRLFRLP